MARIKGAKNGIKGNKVNKEAFEELCRLMCTEGEICGVLRVSHDTLLQWIRQNYGQDYNFKKAFDMFSADAKMGLRKTQFKLAENNPTMAIWLGKQYLGQRDYIEETQLARIEIIDDVPIEDVDLDV